MEGSFPKKYPHLTIIMPVWNKAKEVSEAISLIKKSVYPKDKLHILVIDDGSTDTSVSILKKIKGIKLIISKQNNGKANAVNTALKQVKTELVAVIDGDSYIEKNALAYMANMIQQDQTVGAVTSAITARRADSFLQKLQDIEYSIIVWVRKLLQSVESIYVTPGPLAMYRTAVVKEVGGFDPKNITEDIEIAWRIMYHGYKIRLSLQSRAKVDAHKKFYPWWRQRLRWSMGGIQTLLKYKHTLFSSKYGMLGKFVTPFFLLSVITSLSGFAIFVYSIFLIILRVLYWFIAPTMMAQNLGDAFLLPNVFMFFGVIIFILSLVYLYFGLNTMENRRHFNIRKLGFIEIICYLTFYVTIFPVILLVAMYRIARGDMSWC